MVGNGSTPEGVIQTLKEFPDLLNFQSGFLLAPGFDGSDNEFRAALGRRFELIAVDPDAALSAMLVRRTITKRRDNEATYAFHTDVIYDSRLLDFLPHGKRKEPEFGRVVLRPHGRVAQGPQCT